MFTDGFIWFENYLKIYLCEWFLMNLMLHLIVHEIFSLGDMYMIAGSMG